MNLFSLLFFMAVLALSVAGSALFGYSFGPVGGWLGLLLGPAAAWLAFMALTLVPEPKLPPCENGTCGPGDYTSVGPDERGRGWIHECRCGKRYIIRRGRMLYTLDAQGEAKPYKRRKLFGDWMDYAK